MRFFSGENIVGSGRLQWKDSQTNLPIIIDKILLD